jgi:hypothetical protein
LTFKRAALRLATFRTDERRRNMRQSPFDEYAGKSGKFAFPEPAWDSRNAVVAIPNFARL